MALELVISSKDAKLNKGLLTAVKGADEVARAHTGRDSVFERFYDELDGSAVAVVKQGREGEAKRRVEKMAGKIKAIPNALKCGLTVELREVKPCPSLDTHAGSPL